MKRPLTFNWLKSQAIISILKAFLGEEPVEEFSVWRKLLTNVQNTLLKQWLCSWRIYSSPSWIFIICEFGKHCKAVQRMRFASSWCVPALHVFSPICCWELQMFCPPWITPAKLKISFLILTNGMADVSNLNYHEKIGRKTQLIFSRFQTLFLWYHCNDPKSFKVIANIIHQCRQTPWEKEWLLQTSTMCSGHIVDILSQTRMTYTLTNKNV